MRSEVLASKEAFETFLAIIHEVPTVAYNVDADEEGLIKWAHLAKDFASKHPLDLSALQHPKSLSAVHELVRKIVLHFRQLIEHNGLNKELYKENGAPRHESTAQRLFFAVAFAYCKANNIDISPEVDSGSGQVDFKFSGGFDSKVLVEVKLSTNSKLVHGYGTQLEVYKQSEQTMQAIYLVINVGKIGAKYKRLVEIREAASKAGDPLSELYLVDGSLKASASVR
jgi:hypothetical protein